MKGLRILRGALEGGFQSPLSIACGSNLQQHASAPFTHIKIDFEDFKTKSCVNMSSIGATRESGNQRFAHDEFSRQMQFFRMISDILQENKSELPLCHPIRTTTSEAL